MCVLGTKLGSSSRSLCAFIHILARLLNISQILLTSPLVIFKYNYYFTTYRIYCLSWGCQFVSLWKDTLLATTQQKVSGHWIILCALTVCWTQHFLRLLKMAVLMLLFWVVSHWNVLKSETLICHFHKLFKAPLLCTWEWWGFTCAKSLLELTGTEFLF